MPAATGPWTGFNDIKRCNSMKLRKIGILVFAAAVLMAMTGGTALAKTVIFDGAYDTTVYIPSGQSYPNFATAKSYDAYGSRSVDIGDTAMWYDNFHNRVDRNLQVQVVQYTQPDYYGLNTINWYGTYMGQDSLYVQDPHTVAIDGSHTIGASSYYQDDYYVWVSPYDNSMSYN
jgi:hypothetical protein